MATHHLEKNPFSKKTPIPMLYNQQRWREKKRRQNDVKILLKEALRHSNVRGMGSSWFEIFLFDHSEKRKKPLLLFRIC